jgi:hypothetical protein
MTNVCIHIARIRAYGDLRSCLIFVFESVGVTSSPVLQYGLLCTCCHSIFSRSLPLQIAALAHSTARESPPQGHIQTQHRP